MLPRDGSSRPDNEEILRIKSVALPAFHRNSLPGTKKSPTSNANGPTHASANGNRQLRVRLVA